MRRRPVLLLGFIEFGALFIRQETRKLEIFITSKVILRTADEKKSRSRTIIGLRLSRFIRIHLLGPPNRGGCIRIIRSNSNTGLLGLLWAIVVLAWRDRNSLKFSFTNGLIYCTDVESLVAVIVRFDRTSNASSGSNLHVLWVDLLLSMSDPSLYFTVVVGFFQ